MERFTSESAVTIDNRMVAGIFYLVVTVAIVAADTVVIVVKDSEHIAVIDRYIVDGMRIGRCQKYVGKGHPKQPLHRKS